MDKNSDDDDPMINGWSVRSWWISVESGATVVVPAPVSMVGVTLVSPNEELRAGGAWLMSNAGV